jgi:hypothetical protein
VGCHDDDGLLTTLVASSFAACLVLMKVLGRCEAMMKKCLRIACVVLASRRAKARSVSPLANGSDYLGPVLSRVLTPVSIKASAYRSPDANTEKVKLKTRTSAAQRATLHHDA